jgi:hypothetical protein
VILTACCLHACRLPTQIMLHVSSVDSFAVGSGGWSVFVVFSLISLFWDQVVNIIPHEKIILLGPDMPDREIF